MAIEVEASTVERRQQREIEAPAERHVRTMGYCREMKIRLDMRF